MVDGGGPRTHRLARGLTALPRWARLALAVVTAALGVVLLTRPTTSLGVLALLIGAGLVVHGLAETVRASGEPRGAPARVAGAVAVLWVVAGLFVLVYPGLTVRLVAVVVGVGLILGGVASVGTALRPGATADARLADLAFGAAGTVFGVLALAWPDITLLVVSVVFGARLVIEGVALAAPALGRREPSPASRPRGRLRRWGRAAVAVVAVVVASLAAVVSARLSDGSPVVDAFYAAPRDVPGEAGRLVRSESFSVGVPAGAEAWRILYTTTRSDGEPALASGLVVVPEGDGGPWPVIDWAHGTTGFSRQCAPSLAAEPFESGALFVLPEIIDEGWALVATDYIGLGTEGPHPYLVGVDSAHAVLDAARAARQLADADLGDRTVVWGHSQGGGAALWTGAVADEYAPDVELAGVAALAPASDLTGLVRALPNVTGGTVFASFVLAAYTAVYDDVRWRDYVRPGAETTVRAMAGRCLSEPGVLVSVLSALALSRDPDVLSRDPTTGAFGARLEQNVPPPTISAPLLLGQGGADPLVVPQTQAGFVHRMCDAGQEVDFRVYDGLDHVPLVEAGSPLVPELFEWTRARFAGEPAEGGCDDVGR